MQKIMFNDKYGTYMYHVVQRTRCIQQVGLAKVCANTISKLPNLKNPKSKQSMATNEYLKRYADKYVGELMRGWCFEDQLALHSDIVANINAGTIKTKLGVKAYCRWWIERRKELYKSE